MNPTGAIATGARPSGGRALLCKALFNQMFRGRAQRSPTTHRSRPSPSRPASSPLPAGEGKGEGERQRSLVANVSTETSRPFSLSPALSRWEREETRPRLTLPDALGHSPRSCCRSGAGLRHIPWLVRRGEDAASDFRGCIRRWEDASNNIPGHSRRWEAMPQKVPGCSRRWDDASRSLPGHFRPSAEASLCLFDHFPPLSVPVQ
jgi:hypothetical protein